MSEVSAGFVPLSDISHRYAARPRRPSLADALGTPPRHHASGYVRVPQHCDSYGHWAMSDIVSDRMPCSAAVVCMRAVQRRAPGTVLCLSVRVVGRAPVALLLVR